MKYRKNQLKLFIAALAVMLLLPLAAAANSAETNYMSEMIRSIEVGAADWGYAAEAARNQKIADGALSSKPIAYGDLQMLSKIIYLEAGSGWLSDEWKLCVGEVVMNRVASPEFPNTVSEVIRQPGQYYGANSGRFDRCKPDARCIKLALRLLEGERLMVPSVVFQSNFRQGSGVYRAFHDNHLGSTYFCYSNHPELYSFG